MSTAGISFGGLASGLDTQAIISALVAVERRPILQLEQKESSLKKQKSLFGDLDGLGKTGPAFAEFHMSPELLARRLQLFGDFGPLQIFGAKQILQAGLFGQQIITFLAQLHFLKLASETINGLQVL